MKSLLYSHYYPHQTQHIAEHRDQSSGSRYATAVHALHQRDDGGLGPHIRAQALHHLLQGLQDPGLVSQEC